MKPFLLLWIFGLPAVALDYKRDVMPIFEKKCYDCHSSESKKVKGGLRLDDEEHFFKRFAKNDVVIPGDWDASYLFVTLVMDRHEKGVMPPKNKGEPLTEEEIMTVAKWIHEGAKIAGEKGEKGSKEMLPEKILKFHNGRLLKEGEQPPAAPQEPEWEEWTNNQGKKITARFLWVKSEKVGFEMKGGKKVEYPLEQLSKESQERIKKRLGPSMKMQ
ncbi:MAG: c-type cytochrome domain-containing protein [Akkermansiaceae bacterium]